ncbi:LLM class flavin-dependent oxidoreductase [Amnibacterium kyonggiense]|uniref:Alkanesulfonate monooxygenase SsuD/methylene tetrahydromethanopterin reductase-like flavin-dependent oxidoreductase (Luciferase family) n=1 Tax=Amnibacterium kyonggiense TaxID=595671 RepID=A0A4R7FL73_9MICO|nr:LLM class flavin-dependent oxidoreductase [Amnibacterium kyonggiense]TDS77126.1 alkanesulfonate monooxygenase SsuD/methylene tetrahydromethanopterin reductase-like flavin-dependent oxidoreductase (luciferase family) [Amnibacterium kyonggiense]
MVTEPSTPARAKRGLFLPPFDALADPRAVADLAVAAEQAGWDGVFVWDHMRYSPPVAALADPWICCAAIAARTERVLFGPMVTPLPRRRPHVVARQAASLDLLSGGRLVLGFGSGDDWLGEMSRFGDEADARVRGDMLDEGLDVVTGLLGGHLVEHLGRHYRAEDVRFLPAPERPVPIWIAARFGKPKPLRRAAGYDGVFVIGYPGPEGVVAVRDAIEAERGGTDGFEIVADIPADGDAAAWAAAGATWVLTRFGPYGLDPVAVRARIEAGP